MADRTASRYQTADDMVDSSSRPASGWAAGFIVFAAVMMIMSGIFQGFAGLVAIFENEFYVTTRNYIFQLDATAWGWIQLLLGILVATAGWALVAGRTWARVVAIILTAVSALANFLFIPYYPFWALTVIAFDVFVIWAIAAHGHDAQRP